MEESDMERGATVRIFVGGLGESVKEDELRNIFGSFGSVQGSVDIIRTKGRSFAYCDFIPSSPNCLTKLFGIYNGCVWKGGRLKLEKAKEHFLIRLKREWEEDSAPPENAVDVDTMIASVDEPKKVFDPNDQMKLFIPRLRKVKSLPLKGTGKHKYSFQRYNAPIVPKHFCDCEEHSGPPEEPFKEQTSKFDSLNGGMDTEEINLMNNVMNKFLEKEIRPKVVENVKNAAISVINSDKLQEDTNMEEDLSEEDMDDLVTNIVTTSRTATKKVLRSDGAETSKDGISRKKPKMEKTVGIAVLDDVDGNGDDLQINTRATVLGGTQPTVEPVLQSRPHSIWSQKSSWKQLVGNGKNDTFTVSNILKDTALKEEQLQMSNGNAGEANSSDSETSHDLVEEETEEDDEEDTESSKSDDSAEEEEEDDTDPSESDDLVEEEDGTTEPSNGDDLVGEEEEEEEDDGGSDDDDDDDDGGGGGGGDDDDEEEGDDDEEKEDGTTEPLKIPDLTEETTAEEVPPTEPSKMEEDTKTSDTYMNSGRGSAWRHQSSWTELLKAKSNTSFSLSVICPSQKEGAKEDDTNLESMQTSNAVVEKMAPAVKEPKDDNKVKMFRRPKPKKVTDGGSGAKTLTEMVAGGEGEVCRFMRSSASMKDWAKSKTALSAKRKKKTEGTE